MNIYDCLFAIVTIVFWVWGLGIATLVCISETRKEDVKWMSGCKLSYSAFEMMNCGGFWTVRKVMTIIVLILPTIVTKYHRRT